MTDDLGPQGVDGEALPKQDPETDPELEQLLSSVRVPDAEDPAALRRRVLDAARRPAPACLEPPPRIAHFFLPVAAVAGLAIAAALWLFFAILADPGETLVQSTEKKKAAVEEPVADDAATVKARLLALAGKLGAEDVQARERAEQLIEAYVRKQGVVAFQALEGEVLPGLADDLEARVRVQKVIERLTSPELAWSTSTGPGGFLLPAPGVSEELNLVVLPTRNGLFALDGGTGKLLWKKDGDQQQGTPVLTAGAVYALQPPSSVAAYEPRTGKAFWTVELGASELNVRRMDQTLAYDEKQGLILAATRDGVVVALDRTGKEVWRSENLAAAVAAAPNTSVPPNAPNESASANNRVALVSPAAAAALRKVFTGIQGRALVALDAADGKTVWRADVEGLSADAPAVEADRVYVHGAARNGGAMSFAGIRQKAHVEAGLGQTRATSTVTFGFGQKSFVSCFTADSGKVIWSAQVDAGAGGGLLARPAQGVVVSQGSMSVVAFDLNDGQRRWQVPLARYGATSCAERNGVTYAGGEDGMLLALRVADGKTLWKRNFENDPAAANAPRMATQNGKLSAVKTLGRMGTPSLLGNRLVCTTESGWTFALRLPDFQSAVQAAEAAETLQESERSDAPAVPAATK